VAAFGEIEYDVSQKRLEERLERHFGRRRPRRLSPAAHYARSQEANIEPKRP